MEMYANRVKGSWTFAMQRKEIWTHFNGSVNYCINMVIVVKEDVSQTPWIPLFISVFVKWLIRIVYCCQSLTLSHDKSIAIPLPIDSIYFLYELTLPVGSQMAMAFRSSAACLSNCIALYFFCIRILKYRYSVILWFIKSCYVKVVLPIAPQIFNANFLASIQI